MSAPFLPEFEGRLEGLPKDALARVAEAVRAGTFQCGSVARAQYLLVSEAPDRIHFRARTLLTAIGVGLNEVTLARDTDGGIAYTVRFYRWFYYCLCITLVGLAVPGGMLVGRLLGPVVGLRPAFGAGGPWVTFMLGAVFVLGLLWPFLLTALHKPMARSFLEQLVRNASAADAAAGASGACGAKGMGGGYEYVSSLKIMGLPLVHVAFGPLHGRPRGIAKGVIAIGDTAFGVLFALGGVAVGGLALGGVSFGLLTLGGVAIGGVAVGGLAVGVIAVGGLALGGLALGGGAIGYYAYGSGAIGVHAVGGGVVTLR